MSRCALTNRAALLTLLVAACSQGTPKGPPARACDDTAVIDTGTVIDHDADGAPAAVDCDDANPAVYPGAPEVCGDGRLTDCERVEAGWTADLCLRVTEPILRLRRGGSSLGEIAALGDLRGDGTFTLGVGSPNAQDCEETGVDELGEPTYSCVQVGAIFALEPQTLLAEVGDEVIFPSERSWGVGQRSIVGHIGPRHYGSSLEGLGDLDSDGFDDFIVGNDQRADDEADEVWLFWGPGPAATIDEGVQLFQGTDWEDCIGYDMERAGDLTGDARDDLIVSDPCSNTVWVVSGEDLRAATGPTLSPAARLTDTDHPGVHFGLGIVGRADLTGDGLADLAVSAPNPAVVARGPDLDYVAVYDGPMAGDLDAASAVFTARSALRQADGPVHTLGYTIDAGDLNGDGYGDLVVGDPNWYPDDGGDDFFATFIYHGPLFGARVDVEADAIIQNWTGIDVQAHTDFDADGRDDLLLGSGTYPREVAFNTYLGAMGEAYLVYSPLAGTRSATTDADAIFSCDVDRGECPDFGMQVQAIPDLSGDGVPDVVVADYGNEYWIFPVPLPIR